MLDIKLRMDDLEDIADIYSDFEMEIEDTIDTLEEAIECTEDELSGKYKAKLLETLEQQIKEIKVYKESVSEIHQFILEVIDDINDTVDIENTQMCMEYDEELFSKLVTTIEDLLNTNSNEYKQITQMSFEFGEWYNEQSSKLSIDIDSNKSLMSQVSSSIEEGLRLHDDKKVLNHNYKVIKKLDDKLEDINFNKEIETLQEIQTGLNKFELLNEYTGLQSLKGLDVLSAFSLSDIRGSIASIKAMEDLQNIDLDSINRRQINLVKSEFTDHPKVYTMFEWYDKQGKIHQIYYTEHKSDGFYTLMSVPNGVIINIKGNDKLITFRNYDEYSLEYSTQLKAAGIESKDDLYQIAKYNASKEGSIAMAKASLEAIRYDYPEYTELSDDELLQEISNVPPSEKNSKINNLLRQGYTFDDYAKEIQGHAQLYLAGIGETSSDTADIAPLDSEWQTVLWEVTS